MRFLRDDPLDGTDQHGRKETRSKVNKAFGEVLAQEGVFAGHILFGVDGMKDKSEGICAQVVYQSSNI
jgi:hypothetical protein